MSDEPAGVSELTLQIILSAYADLYVRHRALLAVVAERLGVPPERMEATVEDWFLARRDTLIEEGKDRLLQLLARAMVGDRGPAGGGTPPGPPSDPGAP